MKKVIAVILAGGKGERFGDDKLSKTLGEKTVLQHSIDVFTGLVDDIYIAKKSGKTRLETLVFAIENIKNNSQKEELKNIFIIIHNGANPGAQQNEIIECISTAKKYGACGVANLVTDTLRQKNKDGFETINRDKVYAMQTPQCIRFDLLLQGLDYVVKNNLTVTDDLQILEYINIPFKLIQASASNFKITQCNDLERMKIAKGYYPNLQIGVGEDSHEFSSQGVLTLGGLKIEKYNALKANSDGDVILHALFNAISSAIGGGSLGQTADKMCKDGIVDSSKYLDVVLNKLGDFKINNLSISLQCFKPKIDILSSNIKHSLSKILSISEDKIGITATTGEGIKNVENSIKCICYVSLIK